MSTTLLLLAADGILVLHTLFVAFVVLGQLLVFIGYARHWFWVRNPWFRIGHLAAIAVVLFAIMLVLLGGLGICPKFKQGVNPS